MDNLRDISPKAATSEIWHNMKLYVEMIIYMWKESEESWRKQNQRETVAISLLLNANFWKLEFIIWMTMSNRI